MSRFAIFLLLAEAQANHTYGIECMSVPWLSAEVGYSCISVAVHLEGRCKTLYRNRLNNLNTKEDN